MIEAYKIVEDNDQRITYQYNSGLTWALFGSLAVGIFGIAINNIIPQALCGLSMLFYFYIGLTKIAPVSKKLRAAMREEALSMEGSKYSFSNPLRLTITK